MKILVYFCPNATYISRVIHIIRLKKVLKKIKLLVARGTQAILSTKIFLVLLSTSPTRFNHKMVNGKNSFILDFCAILTALLLFGGFSGHQKLFWDVNLLITCKISKFKMADTRWRPENNKKKSKKRKFYAILAIWGFFWVVKDYSEM